MKLKDLQDAMIAAMKAKVNRERTLSPHWYPQ